MSAAGRIEELVTALVSVPTHERESEAQELLAGWLEGAGFACELQEVEPGRPNLVARRGEGGVFLCSHMDTHPPHGHPHPFRCRQEADRLVGRGALDAKGQIAALMAAVESVPDAPALVVITCDEEGGGLGSERLELPDGPWRDEGGIVLEPTGFAVCTAQTGHVDIRLEASGKSGHAFSLDADRSPVESVLKAIDVLRDLPALHERHPLLPAPRTRLGRIVGGEHLWRRPGRAEAQVSVALVPGVELEGAESDVRRLMDAAAEDAHRDGVTLRHEILDSSAPYEAPEGLAIAQRLATALGAELIPSGMASWTDAENLWTHHGIPCVVFGAGDLATAHSDHEWVLLHDLVRLAQVLAQLLE